jgi:hypothetical protein
MAVEILHHLLFVLNPGTSNGLYADDICLEGEDVCSMEVNIGVLIRRDCSRIIETENISVGLFMSRCQNRGQSHDIVNPLTL